MLLTRPTAKTALRTYLLEREVPVNPPSPSTPYDHGRPACVTIPKSPLTDLSSSISSVSSVSATSIRDKASPHRTPAPDPKKVPHVVVPPQPTSHRTTTHVQICSRTTSRTLPASGQDQTAQTETPSRPVFDQNPTIPQSPTNNVEPIEPSLENITFWDSSHSRESAKHPSLREFFSYITITQCLSTSDPGSQTTPCT